jgi:O-antigen/teichoic acid export membrane protein
MKRWAINIASSYGRFVVAIIAVFMLTPFIIERVGMEDYGLWALALAVSGMLGLMDFGLATAAVKYVAEHTARGDIEGRNRVISTLLTCYLSIGGVALVIVSIYAFGTYDATSTDGITGREDFRILCVMVGLMVALGFPLSLFRAALTGSGNMFLSNLAEIIMTLSYTSLSALFLINGSGLAGLPIAQAIGMSMGLGMLVWLSYRKLDGLKLTLSFKGLRDSRDLLAFSGWAFVANAAVLLIMRMDPILIKAMMPLSAVAIYAVAAKIAEYALLLNKQFSNALMPMISQAHGAGSSNTVQQVLTNGTRYLMALAMPMLVLIAIYADLLLTLWLGAGFEDAVPVLQTLAVAVGCSVLQLNAANVLGMTGKHRFVASAMGMSATINLVITLILLPRIGLLGAAIGSLSAALIIETGVILPSACKHAGVSFGQFLVGVIARTLPPLLPMLGLTWVFLHYAPPESLLGLIGQCMILGLLYLVGYFLVTLHREERQQIISALGSMTGSRRPDQGVEL